MYRGTLANPFGASGSPDTPVLDMSGLRHARAGGWTGLYMNIRHETNVMTGDSQVLRLRAEQNTAATGQLRALQAQAAMIVDGGSGASLQAATFETLAKGKNVTTLRGVEIIADNTEGTGTLTTMVGARIRVIGAGTVTAAYGLQIVNDSASASAAAHPLEAAIRIEDSATATIGCLIDASAQQTAIHDTDQVTLFKFKNDQGTTVTCSFDRSGGNFVFA
jgi:hypothetical protein